MSDSITTSVDVAVSPDVAFDVFTREIDAWYRVDLETLPHITRTGAIRFEPWPGGRLLDVHDPVTGAGRELARITVWEPGQRLCFVDNAGTEVYVLFEARGSRTRVTVAHSGLDRLAPQRTEQQCGGGWAALAPLYRAHVVPLARPLALAIGLQALTCALVIGLAASVVGVLPSEPVIATGALTVVLAWALVFAVIRLEARAVRHVLASRWRYDQIQVGLLGLLSLGLLISGLYRVLEHDADAINALWLPAALLITSCGWVAQGPARGRSLRKRSRQAHRTFAARHPVASKICLFLGACTAAVVLVAALSLDSPLSELARLAAPTALASIVVYSAVSRRRRATALGFDPDQYLAVTRRVSDEGLRPQLLVHRALAQPEYSGWYAYASKRDDSSGDLVAWTMQDLVDHAPEAARPLRAGDGDWNWDHAHHCYARINEAGN